jgi:phospholipid/cholesterol/gamma-HCH transport system ATP-binding protein
MTPDSPPADALTDPANSPKQLWRGADQQTLQIVPGEPLISFRDVRINFDDHEVLRGITFDVAPGETKILLGETGTGKTLIMKLAAGLIHPDAGQVMVMGHDVGQMPEKELLNFRRRIGFVFQEGALFDSMTVAENVSFRLVEENVDEAEIEKAVLQALTFVEMETALEKFPAELSGGMRRRVSIARALVDRPPIIFYDSPTAGLDPVTSQTIITLILRGRDLQDVAALLATHRVQDAFGLANFRFDKDSGRVVALGSDGKPGAVQTLAEREKAAEKNTERNTARPTNVLVLREGKIYFEGPADELLHTKDEYLKKFLASAE